MQIESKKEGWDEVKTEEIKLLSDAGRNTRRKQRCPVPEFGQVRLSIRMLCAPHDPPRAHHLSASSLHRTQTLAGTRVQRRPRELRGELRPDSGEQPGSSSCSAPPGCRLPTLPPKNWRMVPGCSCAAAGRSCPQPGPPRCARRARAQLGSSRPRR